MTDTLSPEERSRNMANIRSRGNAATELRFLYILRKYKIAGWRRGIPLPGKPDFVFPFARVAVFIDGDFWHGNPKSFRLPKTNVEYWKAKIEGNRKRDRRINAILKSRGWKVLRFWQSSLDKEYLVVRRLKHILN